MGAPHIIIPFRLGFSTINLPFCGTPIYGHPHISICLISRSRLHLGLTAAAWPSAMLKQQHKHLEIKKMIGYWLWITYDHCYRYIDIHTSMQILGYTCILAVYNYTHMYTSLSLSLSLCTYVLYIIYNT